MAASLLIHFLEASWCLGLLGHVGFVRAQESADSSDSSSDATSSHIPPGTPFQSPFAFLPVPETETSTVPLSLEERFVKIVNREFENAAETATSDDDDSKVSIQEEDDMIFVPHNNKPQAKRSLRGLGSALVVGPAAFFSHVLLGQRLRENILSGSTSSSILSLIQRDPQPEDLARLERFGRLRAARERENRWGSHIGGFPTASPDSPGTGPLHFSVPMLSYRYDANGGFRGNRPPSTPLSSSTPLGITYTDGGTVQTDGSREANSDPDTTVVPEIETDSFVYHRKASYFSENRSRETSLGNSSLVSLAGSQGSQRDRSLDETTVSQDRLSDALPSNRGSFNSERAPSRTVSSPGILNVSDPIPGRGMLRSDSPDRGLRLFVSVPNLLALGRKEPHDAGSRSSAKSHEARASRNREDWRMVYPEPSSASTLTLQANPPNGSAAEPAGVRRKPNRNGLFLPLPPVMMPSTYGVQPEPVSSSVWDPQKGETEHNTTFHYSAAGTHKPGLDKAIIVSGGVLALAAGLIAYLATRDTKEKGENLLSAGCAAWELKSCILAVDVHRAVVSGHLLSPFVPSSLKATVNVSKQRVDLTFFRRASFFSSPISAILKRPIEVKETLDLPREVCYAPALGALTQQQKQVVGIREHQIGGTSGSKETVGLSLRFVPSAGWEATKGKDEAPPPHATTGTRLHLLCVP